MSAGIELAAPAHGVCSTCGKALARGNRSGLCRSCVARRNGRDPAVRARISQVLSMALRSDPAKLAAAQERARRALALPQAREGAARMRETSQSWRKAQIASQTREARSKAGRTATATRLAWCPPHLRADYKHLLYSKGLRAAEARAIIEDQHAREISAMRARMEAGQVAPDEARLNAVEIAPVPDDVAAIIGVVAKATGFSAAQLTGGTRQRAMVDARAVIVKVLRGRGLSFARIGQMLGGRDHSTLMALHRDFDARSGRAPMMARLADLLMRETW